jgi:hypothetical protein
MSTCSYAGVQYHVKGLLEDPHARVNWYPEPNLTAVVQRNNSELTVNGNFRHILCRRISVTREPFGNLYCDMCADLVHKWDFHKVVWEDTAEEKRGTRGTGRGRRLGYLGVCELSAHSRVSLPKNDQRKVSSVLKFY